jgi:hypothetical protein
LANPNPKPPPEHGRIKKGEIRNPTGRRGVRLTERLRFQAEQLVKTEGEKGKRVTVADAICKIALDLALKGDMDSIKFVFDRIEGKALDRMTIQGAAGGPAITLTQVHAPPPEWWDGTGKEWTEHLERMETSRAQADSAPPPPPEPPAQPKLDPVTLEHREAYRRSLNALKGNGNGHSDPASN